MVNGSSSVRLRREIALDFGATIHHSIAVSRAADIAYALLVELIRHKYRLLVVEQASSSSPVSCVEKIEIADQQEAREKAKAEREAYERTSSRPASRSSSSRSTQSTLVKTLTSPTVIRSVLGILGKMMR